MRYVLCFGLAACGAAAGPVESTPALLSELCAKSTCAGPMTNIEVHRRADGQVGAYVVPGDLSMCTHPPWSYFDRSGKLVLTQAEIPISSPEEGARYQRERDQVLQGLTRAESLSCSKAPPRTAAP